MAEENFNTLARFADLAAAIIAANKNPDGTDRYQLARLPTVTATEVASGTADVQGIASGASSTGRILLGFVIRNDHTTDIAKVTIRNGTSAAAAAVAHGSADVDESRMYEIPGGGAAVGSGTFIDRNGIDSTIILYTVAVT